MSEQTDVTPEELLEAIVTVFHHKAIRILADKNSTVQEKKQLLKDLRKELDGFCNNSPVEEEHIETYVTCYNQWYKGCPTYSTPCDENQFWICLGTC
jgi:hypothetical protein